MRNFTILLFIFILALCKTQASDTTTLRLVHVVFRHGDRTPLVTYKNDPYLHRKWPGGLGQLTNEGKKQMYAFGKIIRRRYENFLPSYTNDEVYVRSSALERCLMSAQLVLAGLLPPVGDQIWNENLLWQPIPVPYVPTHLDNVIIMDKPCPAYKAAMADIFQSQRMKNIDSANKELYNYLTMHTGEDVNDILKIHSLYNILQIEKHHNLELPVWTKNISWSVMHELAALKLFVFSDTPLTQCFTGGVYLKDLISYLHKRSNNEINLKLMVYSGHDSTVVSVLQTLGFDDVFLPEYGAHLIFELHEINTKEYEIKLLFGKDFNTTAQELEMKFCPSPCLLHKFVEELQPRLPVDWDSECLK